MKSLTIKEAAQILGVTTTTLRNWDKMGKLKPSRDPINGYRLYDSESIREILQALNENSEANEQQPLFDVAPPKNEAKKVVDGKTLKFLVRRMSAAFRDSLGGGLLERFEEVSKLLYCKLYDEKLKNQSNAYEERFVVSPEETADQTYRKLSNLYREAIELLPKVFRSSRRRLSGDKKAVAKVAEILQGVDLTNIPTDIKGSVYEELIRNTFEKNDNQQFFTPRVVVDFIVDFLSPTANQRICDPACGSGGFLISTSEFIQGSTSTNDKAPKLVGLEIDKLMAWVTQMNLMMHGAGSGEVYHLQGGGSLECSAEINKIVPTESVDVIITNPPFGSDYSNEDLKEYVLGKGKSSRRRGVLFVERCIDWLKPGGKLAIVIDDSVLNGQSNEDVRELILERCVLEAVVSLPDVTFMPYATAKASILLLRKKSDAVDECQTDIFMADVEHVGRKPNGNPLYSSQRDDQGHLLLHNDLPYVAETWREFQRSGKFPQNSTSSRTFLCPAHRFSTRMRERDGNRFDVQFHHPSREIAEKALARSAFPTPKLIELVVERSDAVVPNLADADEVWSYVGLANIEADKGEYSIINVPGSQLKSMVKRFKPGDILFSKLRPELRKCVLIDDADEEGFVSPECFVFTTVENALHDSDLQEIAEKNQVGEQQVIGEYLAFILRSDIVFGQLVYQITGVGRPRVNKSTVLNLRIPLPPIKTQQEIVAAHKLSRSQYLNYKKRSEDMLEEGEAALRSAHEFAVSQIYSANQS